MFPAAIVDRNGAECRVYDVRSLCKTPGEPFPEALWESLSAPRLRRAGMVAHY